MVWYPSAETADWSAALAYHGKYEAPADILRDEDLSRDAKVRMLEQWRDDKQAYMRATEEGMGGNDRADLLKEINKALAALQS